MRKGITQAQITTEIKTLDNCTEENYLRIILESYTGYNYKARLQIAEILYKKFLELEDIQDNDNLKKNLFAEIYSKMMQSVEDSALLAMMFIEPKSKPISVFTENNNISLYNFFGKAKRGFSDKQILRIFGLKPTKDLLKENIISKSEADDFEKEIHSILYGEGKVIGEIARWKGLGRMYTSEYLKLSAGKNKRIFSKSSAVSVYFNLKHAYKVLIPTETYKKIWKDEKSLSISIVETYKEFGKLLRKLPSVFKAYDKKKMIAIGTFPVSKDTLTEIYTRIYPQAQEVKLIAELQLKLLDDPVFGIRQVRFFIYRLKGNLEPKPYENCPCGSGKKYKKCHRFYTLEDDDLIFDKLRYELPKKNHKS